MFSYSNTLVTNLSLSTIPLHELQQDFSLAASFLLGISVFLLTSRLVLIVDRHVRTFAEEWEFEQSRRICLRKGSSVYRLTEPFIDELCETRFVQRLETPIIELSLSRGGDPLPWKPREFVSVSLMEALILCLALVLFSSGLLPITHSLLIGLTLAVIYFRAAIKSIRRKAEDRVQQIERRLPFGIDLVALMMRAGAGFRDALQTVISESQPHPFAVELQRVLDDVNRGKTLRTSLEEFSNRLRSDDLREMVFAIQKSEELGTPLADIFTNLADQMRLRKSQWAEATAGKAQIRMQGPQFVMMAACMITILTPFLFEMITNW